MTAVCHGFGSKGQYNKWTCILERTAPACMCVCVCRCVWWKGNGTGWLWVDERDLHRALSPHHHYSRITLCSDLHCLTLKELFTIKSRSSQKKTTRTCSLGFCFHFDWWNAHCCCCNMLSRLSSGGTRSFWKGPLRLSLVGSTRLQTHNSVNTGSSIGEQVCSSGESVWPLCLTAPGLMCMILNRLLA